MNKDLEINIRESEETDFKIEEFDNFEDHYFQHIVNLQADMIGYKHATSMVIKIKGSIGYWEMCDGIFFKLINDFNVRTKE